MQAIAQSLALESVFDTSRLVDFNERVQFDRPAEQLTPLVRESGRLVVTDQRLYFQPLHDVVGNAPVRSHDLASIAAVARRRSSLRHVGEQGGNCVCEGLLGIHKYKPALRGCASFCVCA